MKHNYLLVASLLLLSFTGYSQDEGTIVKRERIERNKGIFIGLGPSFTLGKNIGDYSVGFNIEAGFHKRLNRVLSIGPSVSYLSFKYDPEVTNINGGAYLGIGDPNQWGQKYFQSQDFDYYYGYVLTIEGGNLSLLSLGLNLKLNFVPIADNTKISVYGFVRPFVTYVSRKEVNGSDVRYTYETFEDDGGTPTTTDDFLYYNLGDETWYLDGYEGSWGPDSYDALKSDTEITGGVFIGPGIEFMPAKSVSFFLQAAFGYTFPITFVSTESYDATIEAYVEDEFPMTKKGFPSVNVQVGLSFNF